MLGLRAHLLDVVLGCSRDNLGGITVPKFDRIAVEILRRPCLEKSGLDFIRRPWRWHEILADVDTYHGIFIVE